MRKLITFFAITALLVGAGCKDKDAKVPQKPVKKAVVQKKVEVKDTLVQEPIVEEVIPEPPKPANKYFLIAGSFSKRHNADVFMEKLINDGYNAEIIERRNGPNEEFFKVSYKAFHDKTEALAELQIARNTAGSENVWLLIKK
ncbi:MULTISPECIES: SPOR domain-containing protein [unclassified Carboxylicivirga]|uniref:SPOR domain-containing protein n=1 Tax=Carboxylicivirga TaxID=1628153 RepID=UPI003D32C755